MSTIFRSAFSRRHEQLLESFLDLAKRTAIEKSKRRGTDGKNTKRYYKELNEFIDLNFPVVKSQLIADLREKGLNRSIRLRRGDLAFVHYTTTVPNTIHYDKNAVSLMLRQSKKTSTVYGLNFHYLPPKARESAIWNLKKQRINMPIRTLHSYLDRKRILVYKIPYELWAPFVLLPIEEFWMNDTDLKTWRPINSEAIWKWTLSDRRKIHGTTSPPAKRLKVDIDTRKSIQEDIKGKGKF